MDKLLTLMCLGAMFIGVIACSRADDGDSVETGEPCRQPAVNGRFYPARPDTLKRMVEDYLEQAGKVPVAGEVVAVIVPHAGYVFSAPVAAYGFNLLKNKDIDTVILMGSAHSVGFSGASVYGGDCYQTPLGRVPVDKELAWSLIGAHDDVRYIQRAHAEEHSLEVELPFLQVVLKEFKIVPILFGYEPGGAMEAVAANLAASLAGRHAVIVISTDLSHYPSYDDAKRVDGETLAAFVSMDAGRIKAHRAKYEGMNVKGLS
ncbi:AmmeMemoRadiSam system protein B, partial [bacterium]|nr:AmmeMemoRadiSam system protein B [candidate division CSSED10-310 bacterium]